MIALLISAKALMSFLVRSNTSKILINLPFTPFLSGFSTVALPGKVFNLQERFGFEILNLLDIQNSRLLFPPRLEKSQNENRQFFPYCYETFLLRHLSVFFLLLRRPLRQLEKDSSYFGCDNKPEKSRRWSGNTVTLYWRRITQRINFFSLHLSYNIK